MDKAKNKILAGLEDALKYARQRGDCRPHRVKSMTKNKEVIIDYTNWRGQRSPRRILPLRIVFKATEWHKEPQWLLYAWDKTKRQYRYFAMKDIHMWEPSTK
jgi:predicted DNA-binding transcriptional regulator YafY